MPVQQDSVDRMFADLLRAADLLPADDLVRAEFDAIIEANWLPPSPRHRRGRGETGPRRRRRRAARVFAVCQRVADVRQDPRQRSPPTV